MNLIPIYKLAVEAAIKASEIIMDYYDKGFEIEIKADGSPVTEADKASSVCIKKSLVLSNIPIIDEESETVEYHIRKDWEQNWCVDPLDGTKEFIKKNGEFSINIALIEKQRAIFGLIASPTEEKIILGGKNKGVYEFSFEDAHNTAKWKTILPKGEGDSEYKLITSRSFLNKTTIDFIEEAETRFGSFKRIKKGSALKFFDLAKNTASIYPRFAPTMEWDTAAGQAILESLGGNIIQADSNETLKYNKENLKNPFFIALSKEFARKFVLEV